MIHDGAMMVVFDFWTFIHFYKSVSRIRSGTMISITTHTKSLACTDFPSDSPSYHVGPFSRPIRKPLSVLASLMSLASLKQAQNGIPRLTKTVKEPERFLMLVDQAAHYNTYKTGASIHRPCLVLY